MSNMIRFLAALGGKVELSPGEYAAAVGMLDVGDILQKQALLDRDHVALNGMLGGRSKMWCLILSPDEQPAEEDAPADEPGGDEPLDSK